MLLLCLPVLATMAQEPGNGPVEMADAMRQNGKIYVVIAVILTILAGLIAYVVRIDRKLTKLEKESR
jgi:H+/gluconate symporter-like permease